MTTADVSLFFMVTHICAVEAATTKLLLILQKSIDAFFPCCYCKMLRIDATIRLYRLRVHVHLYVCMYGVRMFVWMYVYVMYAHKHA